MSVKLSAVVILVLLAYFLGLWTAYNTKQAVSWRDAFTNFLVKKVNREPQCPEGFVCKKAGETPTPSPYSGNPLLDPKFGHQTQPETSH